jgi:sec-independent protein translocase protein TatA
MIPFAFGMPGTTTIIILLLLGVLLFGRKLPEVGKQLGKGIVEFKKGLKGLEDDFDTTQAAPPRHDPAALEAPRPPQRVATTAPKFEDNPAPITNNPPKA